MPKHQETRTLPFRADELYGLVADVGRYPEFLPWCRGARVYDRRGEGGFHADLLIGFKMFSETFTSDVVLTPNTNITVNYVKGPMKYLMNEWWFRDNPDGPGAELEFLVDFEFNNAVLEALIGGVFEDAVFKMINAFEARAHATLMPVV